MESDTHRWDESGEAIGRNGTYLPAISKWKLRTIRDGRAEEAGMGNNHNNHRGRRRWIILGAVVVVVFGGILGAVTLLRSNHPIDPSKLAVIERGDIARSVVATGKIQPLAKVEVKSKASGIVKQIFVNYADRVTFEG